jgi:glycosyltransferase involved in cell wall biosynthesis
MEGQYTGESALWHPRGAIACGCPVISTDCPGGSAEILENGHFGALVPVRDDERMALAIMSELDSPTPRDLLLLRAEVCSVEVAASAYLALLDKTYHGVE